MAYATKALRRAQISNAEGTAGTAEAATEILFFENLTQIQHGRVFHMPEQDRGNLSKNIETPIRVSEQVEFEGEGDLYDRIANFMFSSAIRGNITPTQPDAINEPLHY